MNPNAYIDFKITEDTAADLYPAPPLRYPNNREYVKAEVAAWVAVQVAGNISICWIHKQQQRLKMMLKQ